MQADRERQQLVQHSALLLALVIGSVSAPVETHWLAVWSHDFLHGEALPDSKFCDPSVDARTLSKARAIGSIYGSRPIGNQVTVVCAQSDLILIRFFLPWICNLS